MARNVSIQHIRGVDANKPTLNAGEFYCATDTGRVWHSANPFKLTPVVSEVDLTAQGAAISTTTMFTPSVTGFYRINFYLKVTRAATTSSTLGGLTIKFSDGTDSVAQTILALGQTQAGASGTTNTGNATTSSLTGAISIWAVSGTAVTYAVAYTSSGGTSMQYEVHLKAVLL